MLGSPTKGLGRFFIYPLLGTHAQVGVMLPFSRAQGSEADRIGQNLLTKPVVPVKPSSYGATWPPSQTVNSRNRGPFTRLTRAISKTCKNICYKHLCSTDGHLVIWTDGIPNTAVHANR